MCYPLETWKDIASIGSSIATIAGIIFASIVAAVSLGTYRSNNALRKMDLIQKLYDQFLQDGWYEFYEVVKNEKSFNLDGHEKMLNKSLTFFDEAYYCYSQKLIDDKSLEYFACEILNFYDNETVMKYVKDTEIKYKKLNYPDDIIPFSGFTELIKKTRAKYKIKEI